MSPSTNQRFRGIAIATVVYWVLAVLPLVIVTAVFPSMPEMVVIHFGPHMQPDGWGPRWQLFLCPICTIGFAVLMWFIVKNGAEKAERPQRTLLWSLVALLVSLVIFNVLAVQIIIANITASSL